jgi:ATPase subunit of ABC transporter with duplicated ATPase domains
MIPAEAIDEPIRSLLAKRAMNRSKGIRMTTDQDKAELAQIMVWFEDWHKKYSSQQQFIQNIKNMSEEDRKKVLGSIGFPDPQ